eukprot:snap_masked-scaffold438_size171652-processed-gene-0.1 protein:Tk03130 transcript:snap_masked-scaffold438_size171652-processed-gene-0.1-mRNA-1 annotation:"multidrug resistance-associated protein 4"
MDADDVIIQRENPRENASFLSIAFFWWLNPLLRLGYKKNLELNDLFRPLRVDGSEVLNNKLQRHWDSQVEDETRKSEPSLLRAVIKTFGGEFGFLGMFTFFEECGIRIAQPLFLSWFVSYFAPGQNSVGRVEAYLYGLGVVLMSALYTFTHHPYFFGVMRVGMRVRITLSALIYRKALRLSSASMGKSTVGQMVNLLANDVSRFDSACLFIHYLWAGPLQLILVVCLTWREVGWSTLAGAGIVICSVPLQSWIGRVFSRLRLETAKKTDLRIRIMSEIINGIKVIKMYAWELPFTKVVQDTREKEMDVIRRTAYFRGFNFSFFFTSTKVILLAILIPFVLSNQVINAEKVFLTLALYNTVRLSMTLFVPYGIAMVSEALVSIKRIQDFLLMGERDATSSHGRIHDESPPMETPISVSIKGLTATWDHQAQGESTLKNLGLQAKAGQMVAIVGPVGSGKTSILQALLGEIPTDQGEINIQGRLSYAAQEPWVFSGSVRHNILFGETFVEKKYLKTLEVSALEHDIGQWEFGDRTMVGERGVALSGGQKARVSLARAIYRDADIYLLDDPLSAVDAQVGKYLYEKCIQTHLKPKLVILVTHQIQYLKDADLIVVLKKGSIEGRGTYTELLSSGTDFSEFIPEHTEEDDDAIAGDLEHLNDLMAPSDTLCVPRRFSASVTSEIRHRSYSVGSESIMSLMMAMSEDGKSLAEFDESDPKELGQANSVPKIHTESAALGSVSLGTYWSYFRSGAHSLVLLAVLILNLATQGLFTFIDVWLGIWTNQEESQMYEAQANTTMSSASDETPTMEEINASNKRNLIIFGGMTLALVIMSLVRTIHFFLMCKDSSVNLHYDMFKKIIRAPSRFFDINPVGRVLNRFSKDMGSIDELLPPVLTDVISIFLSILGIVGVIVFYQPIVFFPTCIMAVLFVMLRKYYLSSSRAIKRSEGIAKSPIFSQLASSLGGLTSIRAYKAESILISEFDRIQDIHTSAWYSFLATTRWFGLWLDWLVVLYLGFCVGTFIFMGDGSSHEAMFSVGSQSGDVGVVLTSCIMLTGMLQWGMRQTAEMENLMTSTERVLEYGKIESEADLKVDHHPDMFQPESWPREGVIECRNVRLQYGEGEKHVLKGVDFVTKSKEKIGIVGRTGAGKSSLIVALFRLTEPTGEILVDGVNIQEIGLHELRHQISIIPQDPLVFHGSLRKNLDPFNEYQDAQIWQALKEAHLDQAIRSMPQGIETEMSEGGSNLSAGQRQLVCLARAILRNNKILILDEATANVDPRTDGWIQETIRKRFADCTVLTIAHRLHTVMDSDRILVMSDGRVAEFSSPYDLLQDRHSVLSELVSNVGRSTQLELRRIARESFLRQNKPFMEDEEYAEAEEMNLQVTVEDDEKFITKL